MALRRAEPCCELRGGVYVGGAISTIALRRWGVCFASRCVERSVFAHALRASLHFRHVANCMAPRCSRRSEPSEPPCPFRIWLVGRMGKEMRNVRYVNLIALRGSLRPASCQAMYRSALDVRRDDLRAGHERCLWLPPSWISASSTHSSSCICCSVTVCYWVSLYDHSS